MTYSTDVHLPLPDFLRDNAILKADTYHGGYLFGKRDCDTYTEVSVSQLHSLHPLLPEVCATKTLFGATFPVQDIIDCLTYWSRDDWFVFGTGENMVRAIHGILWEEETQQFKVCYSYFYKHYYTDTCLGAAGGWGTLTSLVSHAELEEKMPGVATKVLALTSLGNYNALRDVGLVMQGYIGAHLAQQEALPEVRVNLMENIELNGA